MDDESKIRVQWLGRLQESRVRDRPLTRRRVDSIPVAIGVAGRQRSGLAIEPRGARSTERFAQAANW